MVVSSLFVNRLSYCRFSYKSLRLTANSCRLIKQRHYSNFRLENQHKQIPVFLHQKFSTGKPFPFLTSRMPEDGIVASYDFSKLNPEELGSKTDELIQKVQAVGDAVAQIKLDEVTYDNTIKALADIDTVFSTWRTPLEFPQHVSTDKALREASTAASQKLEAFDVEMSMRKDIFDRVLAFNENTDQRELSPEAKRFVERVVKIGKRNGLHLPEDQQQKIKEIKKRMAEISINFQRNLNEENTVLEFSEEELLGLPSDFIDSLEKTDSGKRKVTLKYPHFFPVVRKCKIASTRLAIETSYHSRCLKENTDILEELVKLRQEQADLLNYPTHAAYVTEMRMSKTADKVHLFLTNLKEQLKPLWNEEKNQMLKFKEEDCKEQGVPFDGKINYWDSRYLMTLIEEKLYCVDQNLLKEYFPLPVVTKGLLEIYQELLGLKFEEILDAEKWHPDVQLFKVTDTETHEKMGYFFLDLFPREGKFGHAAVFKVQPGCLREDGNRQQPVAAMLANFTKPTKDKPSLLDHKEVETFFHEFGHVMHNICARADFCLFAGTKVERDFVEAPSQMLENWVWEREPLLRMSGHYKDGSPLPDDLINKLIKSKLANTAIFNLRQISLAMFDHMIHITGEANTQELFNKVCTDIIGIPAIRGTNMAASFGHLAGGYDAQYYGYLWSEVYSMDMYHSRFLKEGIMNPAVGKDYRRYILKPGGSVDAVDMLKNFLGREPEQTAFLVSKGISLNK